MSRAIIKDLKNDHEQQVFEARVSLDSLAAQGLSNELIAVLRDDMNVTALTTVQAGIISKCLQTKRGPNGFPIFPNFHISSGIGTGRSLAHAIVVVDNLIKYRKWAATLMITTQGSRDKVDPALVTSQVFCTGTSHAMIVCPTHQQVRHVYSMYKVLCKRFGITVAKFARVDGRNRVQCNIDAMHASQATIAIGTLERLTGVVITKSSKYRPISPIDTSESDDDLQTSDPEKVCRMPFGIDTKIVVIEDGLKNTYQNWINYFNTFFDYVVANVLHPMCARIVVSLRETEKMLYLLDGIHRDGGCISQSYEVMDYVTSTFRGDLAWQIRPHFVWPSWLRRDWLRRGTCITNFEKISQSIQDIIKEHAAGSPEHRLVLVADTRTHAEEIHAVQWWREPSLEDVSIVLHTAMDKLSIGRGLQKFSSGEKKILFTTAGMVRAMRLGQIHRFVFVRWPTCTEDDEELEDSISLLNDTIFAGKVGAQGLVDLIFDFEYDIGSVNPEMDAVWKIYRALNYPPQTCDLRPFLVEIERLRMKTESEGLKFHCCSAWKRILEVEAEAKKPVVEIVSREELSDDDW